MSENSILKLRNDIDKLHNLLVASVDELETKAVNPNGGINLNDKTELSNLMKKKRKEAGVSMEDLELQTGLSYSTLKRIFSDPSGARFSSVINILNELGINSWAEK
jgi:lambda repressor-like predicted transcriptional regulator